MPGAVKNLIMPDGEGRESGRSGCLRDARHVFEPATDEYFVS